MRILELAVTAEAAGTADPKVTLAEIEAALDGQEKAAAAAGKKLVEALEKAGLKVTGAKVTCSPRAGSHHAAHVTDLAA